MTLQLANPQISPWWKVWKVPLQARSNQWTLLKPMCTLPWTRSDAVIASMELATGWPPLAMTRVAGLVLTVQESSTADDALRETLSGVWHLRQRHECILL